MDATTKTWSLLNLILILFTLGFAAMSANPSFQLPIWLPWAFFTAAGIVVILLTAHLGFSWSGDKKRSRKRKVIADNLARLYQSGEENKKRIRDNDFDGDVYAFSQEWTNSVRKYFTDNPNELGTNKLLLLTPRQFDFYVYNQFDPLGQAGEQDERSYNFRHISIIMEKMVDLIGEFSR